MIGYLEDNPDGVVFYYSDDDGNFKFEVKSIPDEEFEDWQLSEEWVKLELEASESSKLGRGRRHSSVTDLMKYLEELESE